MAQFIVNNGLISRDNSNITGSLNVTGQITASHFGTSSYVVTASYVFNSDTASYTAVTNVISSSYASIAISASIAQTASIMLNPSYGPTPGIGVISPNISALFPLGSATSTTVITSSLMQGGTLMFPFMVYKDCTLVTMSMLGGVSNNTTASIGLYSNSTSSLPEYLLATATIRVANANTAVFLYTASNFTPLKLNSNTIYWVGYTSNAAGAFYAWRPAYWLANTSPIHNPLLGYALAVSGSGSPINFMYSMWCIRSGSYGPTLAATASQSTSSYFPPSGAYLGLGVNQFVLTAPYLSVTYP